MGRSNNNGDEIWEEEELSLCDLPVKEKQQNPINKSTAAVETEDFDFNHWPPPPPAMCAADDIFFQGHMLPLRLSFSSDHTHNNQFFSKNLSIRSESMDHNMLKFRNGSSSSSSSTSYYSRSSSISNNSISIPTNSKARSQKNVFHSHPSPTPQIRSFSTSGRRSRSRASSRWDFFRLGLLRTPRMELHDLKTRTTATTTTANKAPTTAQKTIPSFLGVVSCKKAVDTISQPPPPPSPLAKRLREQDQKKSSSSNNNNNNNNNNVEIREKEKEKETRLSHRRTFEWLKQLSHASFGDEQ